MSGTERSRTQGNAPSLEEARTPCCGGPRGEAPERAAAEVPDNPDQIRTLVRERYGAFAENKLPSGGCCGEPGASVSTMEALGYTAEEAAAVPEGADLGLGCGNPLAYAQARKGETVLDLGSGAGIDCFIASRAVGEEGRVLGVDMTPAMVSKARANALAAGTKNVEFRLGEIEHLPVADSSVDVIISNCVINLSPDKPQVFREALRVLKPGGRLVVSDLVLLRPLPEEVRRNVSLYVGCVAGASTREEYLGHMREAGLSEIEVLAENDFTCGQENFPSGSPEWSAFREVASVKVFARKARA